MAIIIALCSIGLFVSIGFLAGLSYLILSHIHAAKRRTLAALEPGPDAEPAIFALYCQYLLAPQQALREAHAALLATIPRQRAGDLESMQDFFEVLALLEMRSPASTR